MVKILIDCRLNHALNCHKGGYVIIRQNTVRYFLAEMIDMVSSDVEKEPKLQTLEGEEFASDQAHTYIRARGYYREGQQVFFDVKVIKEFRAPE